MSALHMLSPKQLEAFASKHRIRRLLLFGSALRDDFSPDSDIDMLVEFEPDVTVSLFDLGGMQMELSEALGREVDLKTPGFLSHYFRDDVLSRAEVLYERG